ncbi:MULTISPECIES: hypothetical protein [Nocardia]|uniref:Uncharacterized protein n=1 Tax=Nocardia sputorum TaxID=2984338 RepID=A0ABM8D160_9NOCA|nr:hypothetical protein [Nocardia sputorum]BDU01017.1 hypothetical protein IFM12276_40450 [Nocardia sputorum]
MFPYICGRVATASSGGGVRRGTAESFYEDYEEAVWWCDYVARHGLDQARLILDAKRGGSGDGTLLADWLNDHADRLLKVGSIDAPTHRHYLATSATT